MQDEKSPFIPTGVPDIDRMLGGGLPRGKLTRVGGRPNSGKTRVARYLGLMAAKQGARVFEASEFASHGPLIRLIRFLELPDATLELFLSVPSFIFKGEPREAAEEVLESLPYGNSKSGVDLVILDGMRFWDMFRRGEGYAGWEERQKAFHQFLEDKAKDTGRAIILTQQFNRAQVSAAEPPKDLFPDPQVTGLKILQFRSTELAYKDGTIYVRSPWPKKEVTP